MFLCTVTLLVLLDNAYDVTVEQIFLEQELLLY